MYKIEIVLYKVGAISITHYNLIGNSSSIRSFSCLLTFPHSALLLRKAIMQDGRMLREQSVSSKKLDMGQEADTN